MTVFGGTGFLGGAVVRCLARAGVKVRVAARRPGSAAFPGLEHQIARRRVDIRDRAAVADALLGATAAVNAVALYVERGEATFEAIHVEGAGRLAAAAAEAQLGALVHVSGIGADPASASPYVSARGRGEQAVRRAFPEAAIIRPSVLFGPGDSFLAMLERIGRLPVIPLFGRGETRLQPVHVEDVAMAVRRALEMPEAAGSVFELGGAGVYGYREILTMALAGRGRKRLLVPVPFGCWRALARMLAWLPEPPLTRDQIILMEHDNVVGTAVGTFADLGLTPRSLRAALAG